MEYRSTERSQEGTKAGMFGLGCNLALAAAKLGSGIASGSVTILGDGVNSLTDSVSSLLTILGFQMEAVKEDEMHPYGHGRIEYITGFLISLLILSTAINLGKEAVMRILNPKPVSASAPAAAVLALSILVKLGMMFYYQKKNMRMKSPALEAERKDSLHDACVSALTLSGLFIMPHSSLPLDGMLGFIMAVCIFSSGVKCFQENLGLLLGEGLSRTAEHELRAVLSEYAGIESVQAIKAHDYGPDKKIAVAEVNFAEDCDRAERKKTAEAVIQFCRETMNIELFLYSPVY